MWSMFLAASSNVDQGDASCVGESDDIGWIEADCGGISSHGVEAEGDIGGGGGGVVWNCCAKTC